MKSLVIAFCSLAGCQTGFKYQSAGSAPPAAPAGADEVSTAPSQSVSTPVMPSDADQILASRTLDYGQALRTAALKLTGAPPTLDEMSAVTDATSYEIQIDKYLADPRFAVQMIEYFENMMRLGGERDGAPHLPRDTAPTFAAELVVEERPITELFTATSATCPSYDAQSRTFVPRAYPGGPTTRNCQCLNANANGFQSCAQTAGVLTDPGAMELYASHFAFRRTRWIQETFVCTKFPAEFSSSPVPMGSGAYTSPWPFGSVANGSDPTKSHINFQDTSALICANCHTTINHIAPLLAIFDNLGTPHDQIVAPNLIETPALLTDYLVDGELTSWRLGKPAATLVELGTQVAADPDVAECQVARAWNWAMDKLDIVNDQAIVPPANVDIIKQQFVTDNYNLKSLLRRVFTDDDFVRF